MNKFNLFDPAETIGTMICLENKKGLKYETVVASVMKKENSVRLNLARCREFVEIFKVQEDGETLRPDELVGHKVYIKLLGHSFSGIVCSVSQENLCTIWVSGSGEYLFLKMYK
ncbi:MAG: hypothetical protein J6Y30_13095 [Treponema sp.]|nr:hypothetical protein [Treponema sp.]